jgi:hypothetical protein
MTQASQSCRSNRPAVEVLYFEGCPNHEHAVALVRKALAAEQITVPMQLIRVETDEEAHRYGFYGSPSIRINGEDIAPLPSGATPGLACRVYQLPDGHMAPVQAYETLVAALRHTLQPT